MAEESQANRWPSLPDTPHLIACSALPSRLSGSGPTPHLRASAETQLDTPERDLKVTRGRRTQVDGQFSGRGDLQS